MQKRSLLSRIGPAFIVGACVIGPGSVTLMSTTGANYGYSMIWLSLLAGGLMAGFLGLFMRLGCYSDETFLDLTAKKLGRWYAVLCGLTVFMVAAAFQFGNALGVTAGMEAVFPEVSVYVWPVAFTAAAILFMFGFKRIYGALEKMMTFFLIFMVCAFLVNLIWALVAKPNVGESLSGIAKGAFVPSLPEGVDWVIIGGLVGTTFCITAAFFQAYLVKAKGWTEKDLSSGITDTIMASVMLTMIGAVIMMTAATVLYPIEGRITFEVMIGSLEEVFGPYAKLVFSVGFWAAAFSSFVANSLTGGVLVNDGFGLGGKLESLPTKIFATCVLLVGMTTGLFITYSAEQDKKQRAAAAEAAPDQPGDDAEQPGYTERLRQEARVAAQTNKFTATMRQLAGQSSAMEEELTEIARNAAKIDDLAKHGSALDQLARQAEKMSLTAKTLVPEDKPKPPDLKVAAILVGQASTLLAVPLGAIAMILVFLESGSTKGKPLRGWACVFVLFGAAVLVGLAVVMYVKIQPELMNILGKG
ncbi:MAG: NRAMP family divalent metal transporter [Planctomycetota bacterium]|jgi:Mn2+/Fe2+ NRAMP family transporter